MAQAILCDFCGQRPASLLIGNLDNGSQLATCWVDVPGACEQLVSIAAAAVPPADVPAPEAPAPVQGDNGAGAMPAPRPQDPEGEAPAPAGADSEVAPLEVEPATADAS